MSLIGADVRAALRSHVAEPLGIEVTEAAVGIQRIAADSMAAATRMHLAEKGSDPSAYTLVAFGGANPVHAYSLAKMLKLSRIVVPMGAGVMSALGFLVAAPNVTDVRGYPSALADVDWAQVGLLFADMEERARALLRDFHSFIDRASGSSTLIHMLNMVDAFNYEERRAVLFDEIEHEPDVVVQRFRQHREIYEAIAAHDADRAERLMREHSYAGKEPQLARHRKR